MSTASVITGCSPFDNAVETVSEFLERFKVQCSDLIAKAGNSDRKKATILIKALPVVVVTDLQRRIKPVLLSEATYDDIEAKLLAQYEVKKSTVGAAVTFLNRKQLPNESIETYSRVLNDLAAACLYSDCCRDRMIKDVFVSGLRNSKVLSAVLQKCEKKSFNECVEHAKLVEQITFDAENFNCGFKQEQETHKVTENKQKNSATNRNEVPANYTCIRCGSKATHLANNCFAIELKCNKCSKKGHLARACKSKFVKTVVACSSQHLCDGAKSTQSVCGHGVSADVEQQEDVAHAHQLEGRANYIPTAVANSQCECSKKLDSSKCFSDNLENTCSFLV